MGTKAEICLVDDELDIINSFSKVLSVDYNVRSFSSASDAMEAFDHGFKPQAIITDLKMPQLDGLGFINKIHKTDLKSKIVLISGHADKQDTINAMNTGVYRFLEKPFPMSKLSETIEQAVKSYATDESENNLKLSQYKDLVSLLERINESYFDRLSTAENLIFEENPMLFQSILKAQRLLAQQKNERQLEEQVRQIKKLLATK